jgi:hypothetical protein
MSTPEYALELPEGGGAIPISFLDEASAETVRRLLEDSASVKVRVVQADEADTAGHALAAGSVLVNAIFGDDVEGHAMSLRFANPAAAAEFRKRLLATGLIAATLAAGAIGVGVASQSVPDIGAQPGAAPAQYAPAVRDNAHLEGAAPAQYAPAVRDNAHLEGAAGDDQLPNQTNLRGTDKSLPGV